MQSTAINETTARQYNYYDSTEHTLSTSCNELCAYSVIPQQRKRVAIDFSCKRSNNYMQLIERESRPPVRDQYLQFCWNST